MFDGITHDSNSLSWRAKLRGLRISIAQAVNLVVAGMTPVQTVAKHPDLKEENVRQALGYMRQPFGRRMLNCTPR